MTLKLVLGAAALAAGCSQSPGRGSVHLTQPNPPPLVGNTQVMMSFDRVAGFYTAPFPSDDLRKADGTVDLSGFPNPQSATLMAQAITLASLAGGFASSAGIFFETTAAIDPATLPNLAASTKPAASAFVIGIDPSSPDYLARYPVNVTFVADSSSNGPFGVANMLSLVPVQGYPLRPATRYAAVVTDAVKDAAGAALAQSPAVAALASGSAPAGMNPSALPTYVAALAAAGKAGWTSAHVAGIAAFTTGDPTAQTSLFRTSILSLPLPAPDQAFTQTEIFPEFCVYESTLKMPDYQAGTPPFLTEGGGWALDSAGNPAVQTSEEARIFVTIPRKTIPDAGFPVVLFSRTGAGGDIPLVDRGPQGVTNGPPLAPGTGPALYFARAGFAGVSVDGPLGGLRNTTNANEDFTIFNINNALALRDNIRQSALELILQAHVIPTLSLDVSDCPGAKTRLGVPEVVFDVSHLGLMGHSMGATILPLAAALEPAFKTVILSGAGSSWIENVLYKEMPLNVKPAIEFFLQYDTAHGQVLTEHDPALSVFQWAIESADPQVYDYRIVREPAPGADARHVLMFQGIVDHYILPDIANATTLTLGLDLAGDELDDSAQEPSGQTLVSDLLPLTGRGKLSYPVSGNVTPPAGGPVTAVLVQAPGDGIEDGHEIVFQTESPKHQYQCFLESSLAGTPSVPPPAGVDAGCP
jgi:hypothetical protein